MSDLPALEELDASDLGPGWRILVWQDSSAALWYSLAENDALPGSGLDTPVVIAVEQEFPTRAAAIQEARRMVQAWR